jgi:hypothetical protein
MAILRTIMQFVRLLKGKLRGADEDNPTLRSERSRAFFTGPDRLLAIGEINPTASSAKPVRLPAVRSSESFTDGFSVGGMLAEANRICRTKRFQAL